MQTKYTFYVYRKNGNAESFIEMPFSIIDNTPLNLGDKIITINEYSKIAVKFESDDNNAILKIDSSFSEKPLLLNPSNHIVTLSQSGDHDDMFTPGYYSVNISASFKVYRGLYFINSQSVTWDGLVNLRKYLEKIMSGLSRNLYLERMTGQKAIYGEEEYSITKMYYYINNNIAKVINSIEGITKNPISDIEKGYKERYYTKKQDAKSQRWLCTKGLNKNSNIYAPDIVFEKYSFLNRDIEENRFIKKIIQKNLETIIFIKDGYKSIYNNLIRETRDNVNLYNKNEAAFNILYNDREVSKEHKYRKREDLKFLKADIGKLEKHSNFVFEILINLRKIKAILLHYINETWLDDIFYSNKVVKVSQKILRDNRYYQIYDFYLNILAIEKNDPKSKKPNFPSKKTSKLFEYYSVSLVISILRNSGFKWISGWLADNSDSGFGLLNGEIPTNKPIVFIKDNLRIELVYEKEVETNITVINNNISDFVRTGSHYKPDIMVTLFNNETSKLLNAIVIEVKCRMSKNLQSKNGPTGAIEQAKDYYNFNYYDKEKKGGKKTSREVIDKVIIIYPKQDKVLKYPYDDIDLTFLQVEANDISDTSKHYGYEELKKEIDECFFISSDNI
ncbi:hypothetical protein [Clostridium estertheticum]|uniref:DUF2357 domain-containing protein n=1 Tax=Clostridium estertheticum TaxID=238834 RepID=A0AA47ELW3_9CLOT|nr:hypothetical protein [Clostridium estertheticum]MBU3156925.1 hypothetical protein [Clostridium estertheticum]WAG62597.1 hypothetical protein LL038_10305 [Clostridium estertheticum]